MNKQKQDLGGLMLPGILLFLLGLFFIVPVIGDLGLALQGPVDFASLQPHEIVDGMYVEATLDANFGCFAEEYEENEETHKVRTTDLYYVIWTGDEYAEDWRYMGIKVDDSQMEAMEMMAEETYNYGCAETPLVYTGKIFKMTPTEYTYFEEYFLESDFTAEEIEAATIPYCIRTSYTADWIYSTIGAGVFLAVIGIGLFVIGVKHKRIESETEETEWSYLG